jgi:type VI secretion system secreted protein VgrG
MSGTPTPPSAGGGGAPAAPAPASGCAITSTTVARNPKNRARTKIGVGEEVRLSVSPGPATWSITSGTGTLSPNSGTRTRVTFAADDKAGSVTITATVGSCTCTITFTVVQPANWTMKRKSKTKLKHTKGIPDCGWLGMIYVHPDDVNFYNVEIREKDSNCVATGSYAGFNGLPHGNYPAPDYASSWFVIRRHTANGGTIGVPDNIYSGYTGPVAAGANPPFNVGSFYYEITWQWRVVGNANIHDFPVQRQESELFANGKCETRKGGHTEKTMYNR